MVSTSLIYYDLSFNWYIWIGQEQSIEDADTWYGIADYLTPSIRKGSGAVNVQQTSDRYRQSLMTLVFLRMALVFLRMALVFLRMALVFHTMSLSFFEMAIWLSASLLFSMRFSGSTVRRLVFRLIWFSSFGVGLAVLRCFPRWRRPRSALRTSKRLTAKRVWNPELLSILSQPHSWTRWPEQLRSELSLFIWTCSQKI